MPVQIQKEQLGFIKDLAPIFLNGLERETLRIDSSGRLSQKQYPSSIGSSFVHPYITTDFSEAQIEFTTHPYVRIDEMLEELNDCFLFTYHALGEIGEMLWPLSMPPRISSESEIRVAEYGNSPLGIKKHIYRLGLAQRYGKVMQTISGVHYNLSFITDFWKSHLSDESSVEARRHKYSEEYLKIIRHFNQYYFLILYLFGNSPALDYSFLDLSRNKDNFLKNFSKSYDSSTFFLLHGTSLRQSPLGYNSALQEGLSISYDSREKYVETMQRALHTTHWSHLNNKNQLNSYILQTEAELYAPIRPKVNIEMKVTKTQDGINQIAQKGIDYLEIRCLDIMYDNFLGVSREQLAFLQVLILYFLFLPDSTSSSSNMSPSAQLKLKEQQKFNIEKIIWQGRNLDKIWWDSKETSFYDFSLSLCDTLFEFATILDANYNTSLYTRSIEFFYGKFQNPQALPSQDILNIMEDKHLNHHEFGLFLSKKYQKIANDQNISKEKLDRFKKIQKDTLAAYEKLQPQEKKQKVRQ